MYFFGSAKTSGSCTKLVKIGVFLTLKCAISDYLIFWCRVPMLVFWLFGAALKVMHLHASTSINITPPLPVMYMGEDTVINHHTPPIYTPQPHHVVLSAYLSKNRQPH